MESPDRHILIAFDFDGTLYPIRPYDSEQRLMMKVTANKGTLTRKLVKRAVMKDLSGKMGFSEFTEAYVRHIKQATTEHIAQVVSDICAVTGPENLECLKALGGIEGVHMCIISCGTTELARSFLEAMGISHLFETIHGKQLAFEDDKVVDIKTPLASAEHKVAFLEQERRNIESRYNAPVTVVAVGDGPTDMPMLKAAQLGILIDWDLQSVTTDTRNGFQVASSLDQVCDIIKTWL